MRASPLAARIVDRPNERSLHAAPTPRIGGIGVALGALPFVATLGPSPAGWIAAAAAVLAAVSVVDDMRGLPAGARLAAHVAAATLAVAVCWPAGGAPDAVALLVAAAAVAGIAWMANLYNFMDGADGLAGGMAVIGFGALAWAAQRSGDAALAQACVAVAGAAAGFLAFNLPPARVFLGDAGSVPLGFLAGALGWLGVARGAWPAWLPLLVFSPFVVDATVTLSRRVLAGEDLLRAHRTHYYQRLVLGGWSHARLAAAAWALMAAAAASALVAQARQAAGQATIIAGWALAYALLLAWVDRHHPRRRARGEAAETPGKRR